MKAIFGPVPSRRLGRSLGIDVIRPKTCSFDCIYCESGRTTHLTLEKQHEVSVEEVLAELEHFFRDHPDGADALTFSSAGEPTLYRDLGPLIVRIKEKFPELPLVVLTNGSLLWQPEVRQGLLKADRVVPSLDAVTDSVFQQINRPHPQLELPAILRGIETFRKAYQGQLHLEILLAAGLNDQPEELERIARVVKGIGPDRIELNTVVRPPAYEGVRGLSSARMNAAARFFPREITEIIGSYTACSREHSEGDLASRVLQMLRRRPCTGREMADSLSVEPERLDEVLTSLCENARLQCYRFDKKTFYRLPASE